MEHIYVYNFGVGQKSGVARATGATASLAPLVIISSLGMKECWELFLAKNLASTSF